MPVATSGPPPKVLVNLAQVLAVDYLGISLGNRRNRDTTHEFVT